MSIGPKGFDSNKNTSEQWRRNLKAGGIVEVDNLKKIVETNCGIQEVEYGKGEEDSLGKSQHESGAKLDKGKPDASLLLMFGRALLEVAKVGTYGAKKYTRGGFLEVSDGENRYTAALLRHLLEEYYEKYDKDLPVLHAAQVAWNALARLEFILRKMKDG